MKAGRLSELIDIYEEQKTTDPDYGSESVSWVKCLTTRADVTFNSGSESVQDYTIVNTQTTAFRIRFKEGIKETMQIEWRGVRYNITNIEENRKLRYLLMQTSKILN